MPSAQPSDNHGHAFAVLVRESLVQLRREGLSFDAAWKRALDLFPPAIVENNRSARSHEWEKSTLQFMRDHYEMAYYRRPIAFWLLDDAPPCEAPPCEAPALRGGEHASPAARPLPADSEGTSRAVPVLAPPECYWDRGGRKPCTKRGGHGVTGKFCKAHAAELARIAALPDGGMSEERLARILAGQARAAELAKERAA